MIFAAVAAVGIGAATIVILAAVWLMEWWDDRFGIDDESD